MSKTKPRTPFPVTVQMVTEKSVSNVLGETGNTSLSYLSELLNVSDDPMSRELICSAICRLRMCHYCDAQKTDECLDDKKQISVNKDTREAASRLLDSPSLLYQVKEDMDKRYVGMADRKLLSFLLAVTSATPDDYTNQTVTGDSSAGKTALVRTALQYLPEEWYRVVGRLSPTALDRLTDQDFKLLWIQEARGSEGAAPALRLASNDDGGTSIWVTERSAATGRFETMEYKMPGRSLVTTTCNLDIHEEDSTRTWFLAIDLTEEQTGKVLDFISAAAEMPPALGEILGHTDYDIRPVVQEALRQLDFSLPVVIPFAKLLTELVSKKIVRVRRDFSKILGLIKINALLHQRQRPHIIEGGNRVVVAAPQDALIAFAIADDSLEETMSGMDKRLLKALEVAKTQLRDKNISITTTQLGVALRRSSEHARLLLNALVNVGIVDVDKSQKPYIYVIRSEEEQEVYGYQKLDSWKQMTSDLTDRLYELRSTITTNQRAVEWVDNSFNLKYIDPLKGTKSAVSEGTHPLTCFVGDTGQQENAQEEDEE